MRTEWKPLCNSLAAATNISDYHTRIHFQQILLITSLHFSAAENNSTVYGYPLKRAGYVISYSYVLAMYITCCKFPNLISL